MTGPPAAAARALRRPAYRGRVHSSAVTVAVPSGLVEYRFDRRGPRTALICHGGHLSGRVAVGEDVFADAGWSVLAPSRPGYGGTPVASGPGPERFAVVVRELCRRLEIDRVDAVVGFSAGAPLAIALAAQNPDLVGALVLQSARSSLPWPDHLSRTVASAVFAPRWENLVWTSARHWMLLAPDAWLMTMLATMSLHPPQHVFADLDPDERTVVRRLFSRMRSGHGFGVDLREVPDPLIERSVSQPTLVVSSPHDAVLPFAHAEHLAASIEGAELFTSPSLSHLLWFGSGGPATQARVASFVGIEDGAPRTP